MMRFFLLLALLVLIADAAREGGKRKDKWKRKKQDKAKDNLEDRVDKLYEEGCPGSRVHFFFHGDDADHEHSHDKDQHVHVFMHQGGHEEGSEHNHAPAAHCQFDTETVHGHVHIEPADDEHNSEFTVMFDKLGPANTDYTMHVHEYGDLSKGCDSLGGHYDPNTDDNVDSGDMGTFTTNADGGIDEVETIMNLTLHWHSTIVGRSIIVHNADNGDKVACCVIGQAMGEEHDHGHGSSESHDHDHHGHHGHHGHGHEHDDHGHDHH